MQDSHAEAAHWHTRARARAAAAGTDAARLWGSLFNQPSWAIKLAVALAAAMMLLVALVLVIPAVVVFVAVMLLGAAVTKLKALFRGVVPARDADGRKNVRVVVRRQS